MERLMRDLGLAGARRGKKIRTTVPGTSGQRAGDLICRDRRLHRDRRGRAG